MNGLTAAKGLRRSIEGAGGIMRISVPALGDAFGRGKLTGRALKGIEQVLARAGIEVAPSLTDPAGDGWVTLRVAAPQGAPLAIPEMVPTASRASHRLRPAPFLAAALAFLVPALLVLAFALPDSPTRPGRAAALPAPRTLEQQAGDALARGDYTTALRLTRQTDPAKVPAVRRRIVTALTAQARTAQGRRAYVRAIQLARRAARFGRAPDATQIVRQSRAGLDLRRAEQRRRATAPAG